MNEELLDLIKAINEINKSLNYHSFNGAYKQKIEEEKDRLEKMVIKYLEQQGE
ncbi:hypothetical protein [Burkholderia multivorans]|uniref:hypothetical protein n=1 Tax=Burkholderia multivorans TaxID=87883 RepID=UPI001C22B445|nr:hypothetical protein [Burkholderia multivorans]MBU9553873.1 hypothetical protein [Burkholderia multivorans]